MTHISRESVRSDVTALLRRATPDYAKVLQAQEVYKQKLEGARLELSAKGQAILDQYASTKDADPKTESAEGGAPRFERSRRPLDSETPEVRWSRIKQMSADEKEIYVQQKLAGFDAYAQNMQYRAERDTAWFGAPFETVTVSLGDYELSVRHSLETPDFDPDQILGRRDVTAEMTAQSILYTEALAWQKGEGLAPPEEPKSASDLAAEALDAQAAANAVPEKTDSFHHEDERTISFPNVSDLSLDRARMSLGIAGTILVNGVDIGRTVFSRYGNQAIDCMQAYLAAVKDHISKLEISLAKAPKTDEEANAAQPRVDVTTSS